MTMLFLLWAGILYGLSVDLGTKHFNVFLFSCSLHTHTYTPTNVAYHTLLHRTEYIQYIVWKPHQNPEYPGPMHQARFKPVPLSRVDQRPRRVRIKLPKVRTTGLRRCGRIRGVFWQSSHEADQRIETLCLKQDCLVTCASCSSCRPRDAPPTPCALFHRLTQLFGMPFIPPALPPPAGLTDHGGRR